MLGKWNNEFRNVNLIKEIKLGLWLKASFYNTRYWKVNTRISRKTCAHTIPIISFTKPKWHCQNKHFLYWKIVHVLKRERNSCFWEQDEKFFNTSCNLRKEWKTSSVFKNWEKFRSRTTIFSNSRINMKWQENQSENASTHIKQ